MGVEFNHTILLADDPKISAHFMASILSLPPPKKWGPFWMVTTDNGANLDYMKSESEIVPQHYAFLVNDATFDSILNRIEAAGLSYWADPGRTTPGVNRHDGGHGLYFNDPNGHLLEVITRAYGSGGWDPGSS